MWLTSSFPLFQRDSMMFQWSFHAHTDNHFTRDSHSLRKFVLISLHRRTTQVRLWKKVDFFIASKILKDTPPNQFQSNHILHKTILYALPTTRCQPVQNKLSHPSKLSFRGKYIFISIWPVLCTTGTSVTGSQSYFRNAFVLSNALLATWLKGKQFRYSQQHPQLY